ncbi:ferredoxin [Acrocarpospora pleiomorpha]|uniref:Ferredoxin n=1 Tax=Acrocarpospora pleiomorpha TaxID=90975 RepID=A0A5M3Y294_9ACTN|nr:PDR/VanB family oxidoreductase [Acrocarpospora pleiomorpha]GES27432.1 ferredoxin [Acrocarpospora pleiomorpha]
MTGADPMRLLVSGVRPEAERVISLLLEDPHGDDLPAWEPGAHVDVTLPSGRIRQYSLCGEPSDRRRYRIAVLDVSDGRGGSREIHDSVRTRDVLEIRGPRNHFRLMEATSYLLVAGGIGITPILPMARELARRQADWRLVYCGRGLTSMAFLEELGELDTRHPSRIMLVPEDRDGRPDLAAELRRHDAGAVYCCGPVGLLAAAETATASTRPDAAFVSERFTGAGSGSAADDPGFEVYCARSDVRLHVPADRSVLDCLREAGLPVLSSCEQGICGTCELSVLNGDPDHRDSLLNDEDYAGGAFLACVSRSRSAVLTLDI